MDWFKFEWNGKPILWGESGAPSCRVYGCNNVAVGWAEFMNSMPVAYCDEHNQKWPFHAFADAEVNHDEESDAW